MKSVFSFTAVGVVLALLHAAPANALNAKSFVSGTGSDANTCATVVTACATFAVALTKTAANGEISVVDTGNYGPLVIDRAINITNDGGGEAGVVPTPGGFAIVVNAGRGDIVSLRGLVIDGQAVGLSGLVLDSAAAVHVQHCVIRNFESAAGLNPWGIILASFENLQLFVSDTIIFNNGSTASSGGILIIPGGFPALPTPPIIANVVLDRVHLENNVRGLWVSGSLNIGNSPRVVIRDSVVSNNIGDGILATSAPGMAAAFIVVEHTSSVHNAGTGIRADGPRATIVLNDDTITGNGAGIGAVNGGQIISFGNNKNFNNIGLEGAPTGMFNPM